MLHRFKALLDERSRDCLAVLLPNGSVLAAVNLARLNLWVQLAGGLLTIAFVIWRWRRDSFVLCKACRDGRPPRVCPYPPGKRPFWCPKKL